MIEAQEEPFGVGRRISDQRKGGHLTEAFALADEALIRWPGDIHVLRALAWCRYDRDVKAAGDAPGAPQQIVDAATWVISSQLSAANGASDSYDPTSTITLLAVRQLVKRERYEESVTLLSALDPADLLNLASGDFEPPRTEWFRLMTKALLELGRIQQIIDLHQLPTRVGLTGSKTKWIEYRFHLAYLEAGRFSEALAILEGPLRTLKDPWMAVQRARTYRALGRNEDAIKALTVALAGTRDFKDLGFLIRGIQILAELLHNEDPDHSHQHVQLLLRTRVANQWPITESDRQLAKSLGVGTEPADDATVASVRAWWVEARESERLTGKIKAVLPHGGAGFVVADDGREFYFAMPRSSREPAPPAGTCVSFSLTEGFDKKRNIATEQAHQLQVIN